VRIRTAVGAFAELYLASRSQDLVNFGEAKCTKNINSGQFHLTDA
jgi:ribosomal protein L7Ae-like RNA K-turn-binding protein